MSGRILEGGVLGVVTSARENTIQAWSPDYGYVFCWRENCPSAIEQRLKLTELFQSGSWISMEIGRNAPNKQQAYLALSFDDAQLTDPPFVASA